MCILSVLRAACCRPSCEWVLAVKHNWRTTAILSQCQSHWSVFPVAAIMCTMIFGDGRSLEDSFLVHYFWLFTLNLIWICAALLLLHLWIIINIRSNLACFLSSLAVHLLSYFIEHPIVLLFRRCKRLYKCSDWLVQPTCWCIYLFIYYFKNNNNCW